MPSREDYLQQAAALRKLAKAETDRDMALAYNLRAVEYDQLADESDDAGQVQQHGTQPPRPPAASPDQPAQQQQQVQPDDKKE
jgi:hypothetical protein